MTKKFPIKEKWHVIVYLLFLFIVFVTLIVEAGRDPGDTFDRKSKTELSKNWAYVYGDGISGVTDLPGRLPKSTSRTLWLTKTLPYIADDTYIIFRARQSDVKISIGSEVLYDRASAAEAQNSWFSIAGNHYVEVAVRPDHSGKLLTIESYCSEANYLSKPGEIFFGDRGTFVLDLLQKRMPAFICFIVLFITGIVIMALWLCAVFVTKTNTQELLWLALFTLSVSFWELTETQIVQFMIPGTRTLTIMAFEMLMLMPSPIALFFYYTSEREKSKILSKIACVAPLVLFLLNNSLHLLHIVSVSKTLIVTQVFLGVEVLFIAYIQVTELGYIHRNSKRYGKKTGKIQMVGISVIVPLALIEVTLYAAKRAEGIADGTLISLGVIFYIITLALDCLMRLVYRTTRLEQSSELKTQFLANMSHEIRTPLNAMLGFDDAILQNPANAEKVKEYAFNIHEAGENLKDIINSILDISKIEMGQLQIDSKEYSSIELLDNVISMFEILAEKKGLKLKCDIDEKLPEVLIGDEPHLRQIITNLMSNAIKYTDTGSVTLKVKVTENKEESPTCKILFSVKDTGVGIKNEDRGKLFQKFERLNREHFEHTEGSGLGLSIVAYTLKAMGSEIQVNSVYGEGSEFWFELEQCVLNASEIGDFRTKRRENAIKEFNSIDFRAPKAKVLIVDDVPMNIDAASALLEFTKMEIDRAGSGKEAIEKVKKNKYDIIFMDHMMPEMDGLQATESIRNIAVETNDVYFASVPVIALTANAMVGMREVYQQSGMQDLVCKPIEIASLISVLRRWLPAELVEEADDNEKADLANVENSEACDEWPDNVRGIDNEECRKYSPNVDVLKKSMNTYVNSYEDNIKELTGFVENANVKDYTIKVHGLKSTSRIIGATGLAEYAQELESKGNEGLMDKDEFSRLVEMYTEVVEAVKGYLGENEDLRQMGEAEFKTLLQKAQTIADSFDAVGIMTFEDELSGILAPEKYREDFEMIKKFVSQVAFGELSEYIKKMEI